MWHRRNVTKGWVLKWFVVDFMAVIGFSLLTVVMMSLKIGSPLVSVVLEVILVVAVTILFTLSFMKARKFLQRKNIRQANVRNSQEDIEQTTTREDGPNNLIDRQMLRLTMIFFAMYAVFLMATMPVLMFNILWSVDGYATWIPITVITTGYNVQSKYGLLE